MEELEIKGKKYISSKRAAKLTGYAKDYIGQLARAQKVSATRVGRAWYVSEEEILSHAGKPASSEDENITTESSISPQESNTRSLNDLQAGKVGNSSKLKTWSNVTYLEDNYSLLPEKIALVEPNVSIKNIVPENIVTSAEKSIALDTEPERKVQMNRKVSAPVKNTSIDGVSVTTFKKEVKKIPSVTKEVAKRRTGSSKSNIPVISTLLISGVTAGFLVLILSGNVIPVEWGTGSTALSASTSSAPVLDGFISYLQGLLDSAVLLLITLFSTIFSMFWEFVSNGISFVGSLF